jgi:hypothetical protein
LLLDDTVQRRIDPWARLAGQGQIANLHLDQKVDVMPGFLQILKASFIPPPANVLHDVPLYVGDSVPVDELDRLDGETTVVPAANLDAFGAHADAKLAHAALPFGLGGDSQYTGIRYVTP